MDENLDVIVSAGIAIIGGVAALHARASRAENAAIREANDSLETSISNLSRQHSKDVARFEGMFMELWTEVKSQRDALTSNREATIKLTGSIERLNEILTKLEHQFEDTVRRGECKLLRKYHENAAD
jgi:hypothetical protein